MTRDESHGPLTGYENDHHIRITYHPLARSGYGNIAIDDEASPRREEAFLPKTQRDTRTVRARDDELAVDVCCDTPQAVRAELDG